MTNYRTYSATLVPSGSVVSASSKAWGVLVTAGSSGSIQLGDKLYSSSSIKLEHLSAGTPFPCYVTAVSCSLGNAYILQ
jgi:hypothetical protein